MKLYIALDVTAEVVEVPDQVLVKIDFYKNKFLDWLYNPRVKHKYRVEAHDATGKKFVGMSYGAEAFVEWLNKKVLRGIDEKASVVATDLEIDEEAWIKAGIPYIFF